ncbi:nucleotidyltransferase family protein [Brevibacillus sp. NRS-1366]|uniref:nucleotidyltransferase family protein n=1 Tax=Brevibacillus sp. NRS-1366 TaxID=3233899 RepID=UPI003D24FE7A
MHDGCAVILAAGMAARMGSAKQLLPLKGSCMLEHVIKLALVEDFTHVIVVIGHEAERIVQSIQIDDPRFLWHINPLYELGQSTSFKAGIAKALEFHSSVMVFLGDQPFIQSQTVHSLWSFAKRKMQELQEPFVIQPIYQEKPGHPVFFGNICKEQFARLEGDQGAKPIIADMQPRMFLPVDDPGIHLDIDTREDFEQAEHIS